MLHVAWKRGLPRNFARFVLFRPIQNRFFNLLCVLNLFFFRTLAVNSVSDFFFLQQKDFSQEAWPEWFTNVRAEGDDALPLNLKRSYNLPQRFSRMSSLHNLCAKLRKWQLAYLMCSGSCVPVSACIGHSRAFLQGQNSTIRFFTRRTCDRRLTDAEFRPLYSADITDPGRSCRHLTNFQISTSAGPGTLYWGLEDVLGEKKKSKFEWVGMRLERQKLKT